MRIARRGELSPMRLVAVRSRPAHRGGLRRRDPGPFVADVVNTVGSALSAARPAPARRRRGWLGRARRRGARRGATTGLTMAVHGAMRMAAGSPPASFVVDVLERLVPGRRDILAVLTFHRVAPLDAGAAPGLLSATPDGFADLLDALAKRHAIIGIEEVLRRAAGGPSLPPRSLLLTVDDAYRDFADHAWPRLRRARPAGRALRPDRLPRRPRARPSGGIACITPS